MNNKLIQERQVIGSKVVTIMVDYEMWIIQILNEMRKLLGHLDPDTSFNLNKFPDVLARLFATIPTHLRIMYSEQQRLEKHIRGLSKPPRGPSLSSLPVPPTSEVPSSGAVKDQVWKTTFGRTES